MLGRTELMMRVVQSVWAVVGLSLVVGRVTAEPTDAHKVLADAATAARELRAVRYEAAMAPQGAWVDRVAKLRGTVLLERAPGAELPRLRVEAQVTPPGQTTSTLLQVAFDGKTVTQCDQGQRIWLARELALARNAVGGVLPLLLLDLTADNPFQSDGQATLSVPRSERIDDQDCDVVRFENASSTTDWYFGRTDHLPHRVQRILKLPGGEAALALDVKYLALNPDTSNGPFRFEQPEGYRDMSAPPMPGGNNFLEAGTPAPDWTLKTLDGQDVALKSLRGKVVLLDFWATWCMPCKMAMPGIQKLYEKYKGKPVAIYGVNCWERGGNPVDFWKKSGYTYPILLGGDLAATQYKVTGIPTFYLIGPDGKVLWASSGVGAAIEQELDRRIEAALPGATSQPAGSQPATSQPATSRPAESQPAKP
jgi:thiol-disulfide isomerase/thioredoxin